MSSSLKMDSHPVSELHAGDHLTRQEFEACYERMPQVKKAELIEGVVHMPSPVRVDLHGKPHADLLLWLGTYAAKNPDLQVADNATIRLDMDNEPQPDAILRVKPEAGGQSSTEDGYIKGAPEFIAEITASSRSYDLFEKKEAYRRNGVFEYLVWLTEENRLLWWRLEQGAYVEMMPEAETGILESQSFPGLKLNVPALLSGNTATVLATLG